MNPAEPVLLLSVSIIIVFIIVSIANKKREKCIHEYEDYVLSMKRHSYSSIIYSTVVSKCKLCGHIKDKP